MRAALAGLALLAAGAAAAQEGRFAAGSEAESWGLSGEEPARFEARVVDVLCALTGDCPADCGGGGRQLGLLRTADRVLTLAVKNTQPIFSGAAVDLAPFCGATVEVDGLLVGDPSQTPAKVFQVQRIRRAPDGGWEKAERWSADWDRRNPALAADPAPWFRKDPEVNARIERDGFLGLGHAEDGRFLKDWQ